MANHDMMRNSNLLSVFEAISKHGPVAKKEIQALTGLSWGSISGICADLLNSGIIRHGREITVHSGRAPKNFEINPDKNLIIGVDINLKGITGVVIDLRGRTKSIIEEPLQDTSRSVLMSQAKNLIHKLLMKEGSKNEVKGIGISFPGHVNLAAGLSVRIPHLNGFDGYPICDDIKKEFGIDTLLDNDTNCIAVAEHIFGIANETDNFLLLRLSSGIGMATVVDGEVFRGKNGATGEIGHMTMHPDGPKCQCGNNGCLETYASLLSIIGQCSEGASLGLSQILADSRQEPLTIHEIMNAGTAGDPYCRSVLGKAAAYTGIALANAINLLDPDRVVLCGELAAYDYYSNLIIHFTQEKIWRNEPVDFCISYDHGISAAIGAATLFIKQIFLKTLNRPEYTGHPYLI